MKSILDALRDLAFTLRLNSDRLLYAATVAFAICLGAFIGSLLYPF